MIKPAIFLSLLLVFFSAEVRSSIIECVVEEAVRMGHNSGRTNLIKLQDYIGSKLTIDRNTGEIKGDKMWYGTYGEEITIVRREREKRENLGYYVIDFAKGIKVVEVDGNYGQLVFNYYFDWFGILISGNCDEPNKTKQ